MILFSRFLINSKCNFNVTVYLRKMSKRVNVFKPKDLDYGKENINVADDLFSAVKEELKKGTDFSSTEWDNFTLKLINQEIKLPKMYVTKHNVDGVIMKLCKDLGFHEAGVSFFKHLNLKQSNIHVGVLSRYLAIIISDTNYAINNESLIMNIISELRSKQEVLEPTIAEICIKAVCFYEKHWRKAFEFLEDLKIASIPGPLAFNPIIEACFKFDDVETGWQYLHHMTSYLGAKPSPQCHIAYINYCRQLDEIGVCSLTHLERLFNFYNEYQIPMPDSSVIIELEKLIDQYSKSGSYKWQMKRTNISNSGLCKSCKKFLDPVKLSSSDLESLSGALLKRAVVGKDIFIKTNPKELVEFKKFIANVGEYNIVIDGLNVAYSRNNGIPDPKLLRSVVEHFVTMKWKVLVLGREHMRSWSPKQMNYLRTNAKLFLASNNSQDDPFLLYAALQRGPNTYFLSRDYMRPHLHLLQDIQLKLLFKKWLCSHQFRLTYVTNDGETIVEPPLAYLPCAQKLSNSDDNTICWHIPYEEKYMPLPPNTLEPPSRWLCIQRL